jgi:predicted metalloprotease
MKIGGRWRSGNVQDRRGARMGLAGGGIGAVVITIVALMFGVDPGAVLQEAVGTIPPRPQPRTTPRRSS